MANRPGEALAVLERTARSHWEHYLWLAICYAATKQESAARRAAQEAIGLRPNMRATSYPAERQMARLGE